MAEEAGLSLATVAGTGPNDRVLKADVEDALAAAKAAPVAAKEAPKAKAAAKKAAPAKAAEPSGLYEDMENSTIRKVIAERLTFSKQNIPHYYVTISVSVDELLKIRARLNKVASSKISVNDMVIKAASLAATKVPETNSQWMDSHTRQFKHVNMCVAVQTDHGLMVPVVKNTNLLGLEEISAQVKDVAGKARNNKLTPELMNGGTFTISNMGMFGVH
jgi:pyruvate dehydrogenase E2 component (dihydrolipoamide acetyltransferase)